MSVEQIITFYDTMILNQKPKGADKPQWWLMFRMSWLEVNQRRLIGGRSVVSYVPQNIVVALHFFFLKSVWVQLFKPSVRWYNGQFVTRNIMPCVNMLYCYSIKCHKICCWQMTMMNFDLKAWYQVPLQIFLSSLFRVLWYLLFATKFCYKHPKRVTNHSHEKFVANHLGYLIIINLALLKLYAK